MTRQRRINRNVRRLVAVYLAGCMPGTRVSAKDLARQLSNSDRVFLTGTIAQVLQGRRGLSCVTVNDYVVG